MQASVQPDQDSWQESEKRKNCLRIAALVVLALLVVGVILLIINYSKNRDHHQHIPQVVRHHLISLKHHAQNIGTRLFSR